MNLSVSVPTESLHNKLEADTNLWMKDDSLSLAEVDPSELLYL